VSISAQALVDHSSSARFVCVWQDVQVELRVQDLHSLVVSEYLTVSGAIVHPVSGRWGL
jgi:hypothetical protein